MTTTDDEQTLIQLQNDWMDAWQRLDRARLEEILAPEFTLTSARTDQWMRLLEREQRPGGPSAILPRSTNPR